MFSLAVHRSLGCPCSSPTLFFFFFITPFPPPSLFLSFLLLLLLLLLLLSFPLSACFVCLSFSSCLLSLTPDMHRCHVLRRRVTQRLSKVTLTARSHYQSSPAAAMTKRTMCSSAQAMPVRAAVAYDATSDFKIENLNLRAPKNNELLVRLVSTGICHTDIVVKGFTTPDRPIVLGHEGTGVVEHVGSDVTGYTPGDHVLMTYSYCGHCTNCVRGKPSYCFDHGPLNFAGTQPDGSTVHSTESGSPVFGSFFQQSSFATHAVVTPHNTLKVDKDLPLEKLAPLGCGVQTGAGAVINTLQVRVGNSIAVFGCGAVGLSAVMAAKISGAGRVIAIDLKPNRLNLALELGATDVINAGEFSESGEVVERIKELTGGAGSDFALDTSGNPTITRHAFDALKPMGTAGLIGGSSPGTEVKLDMLGLLTSGKQIRGVIQGDSVSRNFIPTLIDLYQQDRFPFTKMITMYENGLDDINRAVEESHTADVIKPVLKLSDP
jgi:aryl-alcohol dehydrogenase